MLFVGLEGVGNLLIIGKVPAAAIWLAAKLLFITGLIRGWRWVFVLFLVVTGFHVLGFSTTAPFVAFLNLILVLLVGSSLRHFFPGNNPGTPSIKAMRPEFREAAADKAAPNDPGTRPLKVILRPPAMYDRELDA